MSTERKAQSHPSPGSHQPSAQRWCAITAGIISTPAAKSQTSSTHTHSRAHAHTTAFHHWWCNLLLNGRNFPVLLFSRDQFGVPDMLSYHMVSSWPDTGSDDRCEMTDDHCRLLNRWKWWEHVWAWDLWLRWCTTLFSHPEGWWFVPQLLRISLHSSWQMPV